MKSQHSNHDMKRSDTTAPTPNFDGNSLKAPAKTFAPDSTDPRALVQRLRTQPGTLQPKEALALQRLIGNSAVTRLIRKKNTNGPTAGRPGKADSPSNEVQRLVSNSGSLYVPRGWTKQSVKFNDEATTIEALLDDHEQKPNLIGALKNDNLDPDLYEINVKDKGGEVVEAVQGQLPEERRQRSATKRKINQAFSSYNKLLKFSGVPVKTAAALQENLILNVKDMLPEPDDLAEEMEIAKVCALIAIVKAEGKGPVRAFLTGKIDGVPGGTAADQVYYKAMHKYYYNTKGLLYDEMSTHPQIFKDWGYSMIFSGRRNWEHLYKNSPQLKAGKKYIFDVEGEIEDKTLGHTMHVTMKKDFTAEMATGEKLTDYFECHNDNSNWTERHFACKVINIFTK